MKNNQKQNSHHTTCNFIPKDLKKKKNALFTQIRPDLSSPRFVPKPKTTFNQKPNPIDHETARLLSDARDEELPTTDLWVRKCSSRNPKYCGESSPRLGKIVTSGGGDLARLDGVDLSH
jgi:hypothetical protein